MTGLIWLVQLVHYPAFKFVGPQNFFAFHRFHSQRISWIVVPVMTLEVATGVLLVIKGLDYAVINLVLLAFLWLATGVLSVPLHNKLSHSLNDNLIHRLILTNWPRTILWSLRSLGLVYVLLTRLSFN